MTNHNPANYTFAALAGGSITESLSYLVGLVDANAHLISDVLPAKRILSWLYECEEQAGDADSLKSREASFFKRYFPGGYFPQTPCMVTKAWCPISDMLERGLAPEVLNHEDKIYPVATGIWKPAETLTATSIDESKTSEELFWAIVAAVSKRAAQKKMWISIIAQPGWEYESAIGSLPNWPEKEVAKADRALWKRTPEG